MRVIRTNFSQSTVVIASSMLLLLCAVIDLTLGSTQVRWWDLFAQLTPEQKNIAEQIIIQVRLPRVLLVMAVGFCLAFSGAALQGLLQNPLAGPGLLGVSSAAVLGAVLALFYGLAAVHALWVPLCGLGGALLAMLLIFILAGRHASTLTLILSGVAISSVMSSLTALALNFSKNPYAMSEMVYWLLGSLDNRSIEDVYLSVPFIALGCVLIYCAKNYLDALSLGEQTAQTMGFSMPRYRSLIIIGVALSVGAAVAVSGSIGFVGLVVPHLVRPFVANQPSRLLLPSGIVGAVMLLLADILVQYVGSFGEAQGNLKLGVVTALVGGPFFLWLLYRLRHEVS